MPNGMEMVDLLRGEQLQLCTVVSILCLGFVWFVEMYGDKCTILPFSPFETCENCLHVICFICFFAVLIVEGLVL